MESRWEWLLPTGSSHQYQSQPVWILGHTHGQCAGRPLDMNPEVSHGVHHNRALMLLLMALLLAPPILNTLYFIFGLYFEKENDIQSYAFIIRLLR